MIVASEFQSQIQRIESVPKKVSSIMNGAKTRVYKKMGLFDYTCFKRKFLYSKTVFFYLLDVRVVNAYKIPLFLDLRFLLDHSYF